MTRARIAVVLALLAPLCACDAPPTAPAPAPPTLSVRAVTLGDWSAGGLASSAATTALDEVAALGANAVVMLVTTRQSIATSHDLGDVTPSAAALQRAALRAGNRGLAVWVKLHVDVRDGTWRGEIAPADVDAWFDAYAAFVRSGAALAASIGAAGLVVGTELGGVVSREAAWRDVIRQARETFDGPVVYAASWDEAERVPFWDAVDYLGVDAYYPVAGRSDPTRFEILAGWQPWLARLDALRLRAGRDVFVTEIGYASMDGCGMRPYAWTGSGPPDPEEQADLYWGALTALAGAPWIRGMAWWNWTIGEAGGPDDRGYTPRGKPAQGVLRDAWSGGDS